MAQYLHTHTHTHTQERRKLINLFLYSLTPNHQIHKTYNRNIIFLMCGFFCAVYRLHIPTIHIRDAMKRYWFAVPTAVMLHLFIQIIY